MNAPLKSGDVAVIIQGALGAVGPNVGKHVTVGVTQGEHSKHGRIVRIHGQNLVTEYGAMGNECDIPVAWLQKLPPSPAIAQGERQEVQA